MSRSKAEHAAYMREYSRRPGKREVKAEADAIYAASDRGREVRRRARQAYKARNAALTRERRRIGMRVLYAVRTGRLVREPCASCGAEPTEGHHANGYAPEHELDVVWLCVRHHRIAHGKPVLTTDR